MNPGGPRRHRREKFSKVDASLTIKEMYKTGRKYIPWIIVSMVLLLAYVVISIIAPRYTGKLSDAIAVTSIDMDLVSSYCYILIGIYIANIVSSYASSLILTIVSQRYSQDLRKAISEKINRMPLSFFDKTPHGDILSVLTNDVDQIASSMQQAVSMLIQSVFLLVGVLIMMFIVSWQMSLAALISLPLMFIFILFMVKLAMPQFQKRQDKLGEVESIVEESYSGQIVIKAFNAQDMRNEMFENSNKDLKSAMFKAEICGGMMQPTTNFISNIAYAAVFIVGGLLVAGGSLTIGVITEFMMYVNLFQSPLSQIAQAVNQLQLASASGGRVFKFLNEKEEIDETNKAKVFFEEKQNKEVIKGEVEFRHVNFSYDSSRTIIPDFSAKIEPGMRVAIVGPTGAGKTTMVNLLMRFYETNSGDILIDGVPIKEMSRHEVRDIFGMVLQDTWVFKGTVRENMVYNTPNVTEEQIKDAIHDAHLTHYIRTLPGGLDYVIEDENSISGGQRQLLTIARAMIKNAPLLILDEATSNVDTRTEQKIEEAMERLTKGRTSFVIAHRLSTIKNADLILVMRDGNIVEQGTHESLMDQNGFYASLYNSQFADQVE